MRRKDKYREVQGRNQSLIKKESRKAAIVLSAFFLGISAFSVGVSASISSPVYAEEATPPPATTSPSPTASTTTPTPTPTGTTVNVQMNYLTGRATITAGTGGSSKIYMSTNKMRTWELIELNSGIIDLNGILKSSNVTVYFKGNKDTQPVEVILQGEEKGLKAIYSVANATGVIKFENAQLGDIEYRVTKDSNWQQWIPTTETAPYEVTGITLQFRTKATPIKRSGKIVSLKIPKRPTAPSIKVSPQKLSLTGLKSGSTQYRMNSDAAWKTFTPTDSKMKDLDLTSLFVSATAPPNTMIPAGIIEVRTMATDKKVASAVRAIEIAAQRTAPGSDVIRLEGTTLTCTDATSKNPYEYTMLHPTDTLDLSKAKWISVTSAKPTRIKKTGNAETIPGDVMYIRRKSIKDPITKEDILPSLYSKLSISTITVNP